MALDVFISHAHNDAQLARRVVNFLKLGVGVDDEIRCSSNMANRFRFGGELGEEIKRDLKRCKSFMPLLTENSIGREWVMIEIACAWVLDKPIFPITAGLLQTTELPSLIEPLVRCDISNVDQLIALGVDMAREIYERYRPNAVELKGAAEDLASSIAAN